MSSYIKVPFWININVVSIFFISATTNIVSSITDSSTTIANSSVCFKPIGLMKPAVKPTFSNSSGVPSQALQSQERHVVQRLHLLHGHHEQWLIPLYHQ